MSEGDASSRVFFEIFGGVAAAIHRRRPRNKSLYDEYWPERATGRNQRPGTEQRPGTYWASGIRPARSLTPLVHQFHGLQLCSYSTGLRSRHDGVGNALRISCESVNHR